MFQKHNLTTLPAWKRSSRSAPRCSRCASRACSPRAGASGAQPQLAAWSAGLAAYALGAAAIAWGAAAGWNDGVFRAYYLFGGLLTAALLGAGSLLGIGVARSGPGRARLRRARGRRRAGRPARGAGRRHVDPGGAGAPERLPRARRSRSSATSPARSRSSASRSRGCRRRPVGNALLLAGFALAAAGSALAGLGAAQTAAFVAVLQCFCTQARSPHVTRSYRLQTDSVASLRGQQTRCPDALRLFRVRTAGHVPEQGGVCEESIRAPARPRRRCLSSAWAASCAARHAATASSTRGWRSSRQIDQLPDRDLALAVR